MGIVGVRGAVATALVLATTVFFWIAWAPQPALPSPCRCDTVPSVSRLADPGTTATSPLATPEASPAAEVSVDRVTTAPPSGTNRPLLVEPTWDVARFRESFLDCLSASGHANITLWNEGDSHVTQMMRPVSAAFGASFPRYIRHVAPLQVRDNATFLVSWGSLTHEKVVEHSDMFGEYANSSAMYYLANRIPWDLIWDDTSPNEIYEILLKHFRQLNSFFAGATADVRPRRVALLMPHIFKVGTYYSLRRCFAPHRMDSMRRVTACAVVEFNRAHRDRWFNLSLFDPTEFLSRYSAVLQADGHHVVAPHYSNVVMGFMSNYVCPNRSPVDGIRSWDDMEELSKAFECEEVRSAQLGQDWVGRTRIRDTGVDRVLPWRREPNCACRLQPLQDDCSIGHRFREYLYNPAAVKDQPHEAFVVIRHICDVRKFASDFSKVVEYPPTHLDHRLVTDDNVLRHVVGAIASNRSIFAQCMKNLGYSDPLLGAAEWSKLLGDHQHDHAALCTCRSNCSEAGFTVQAGVCDDSVINSFYKQS